MKTNSRRKWVMRRCESVSLFDGLDEAIVGIAGRPNMEAVVVYDFHRIMDVLCRDMSPEDAQEHFNHNITCLYCGPTTPLVMERIRTRSKADKTLIDEVQRLRDALTQIAEHRDEPYSADFAKDILARREAP